MTEFSVKKTDKLFQQRQWGEKSVIYIYTKDHPYIQLEIVVETKDRLQTEPAGHVSKGPGH